MNLDGEENDGLARVWFAGLSWQKQNLHIHPRYDNRILNKHCRMYIITTNDRMPTSTETMPAWRRWGKLFDMYRSSASDQSFEVIFFNMIGSFSISIQITELMMVRFCIEVGHMPFRSVFLFSVFGMGLNGGLLWRIVGGWIVGGIFAVAVYKWRCGDKRTEKRKNWKLDFYDNCKCQARSVVQQVGPEWKDNRAIRAG